MHNDDITNRPDVPNVQKYLSDIAFLAKEAAEATNPRLLRDGIAVLKLQIQALESLAGGAL